MRPPEIRLQQLEIERAAPSDTAPPDLAETHRRIAAGEQLGNADRAAIAAAGCTVAPCPDGSGILAGVRPDGTVWLQELSVDDMNL